MPIKVVLVEQSTMASPYMAFVTAESCKSQHMCVYVCTYEHSYEHARNFKVPGRRKLCLYSEWFLCLCMQLRRFMYVYHHTNRVRCQTYLCQARLSIRVIHMSTHGGQTMRSSYTYIHSLIHSYVISTNLQRETLLI
jgi:hypothetical protein